MKGSLLYALCLDLSQLNSAFGTPLTDDLVPVSPRPTRGSHEINGTGPLFPAPHRRRSIRGTEAGAGAAPA
jgi:hypothetical protein